MEKSQELLEAATAIESSDPLWIPEDIETKVPETDMAFELRGPEPDNIEEQLQTAKTSNMEKNIQEKLEEEICIDPLDFLKLSWKSENSENSSENSENYL